VGNIGPWELALILFIALIVFGPGKLPDIAKGLGNAVNEFKQASSGTTKNDLHDSMKTEVITTPVEVDGESPKPS
jgi:sec-independent protein translocase protein TatA